MKIRKLRPSDIKNASSIVENNYSKTYGKRAEKELWAMFKNKVFDPIYFVAEENKKIIAFGGYVQSPMDYHIYEIFWVNVSHKNQNKGTGTKLIQHIIKEIKKKRGNDKASGRRPMPLWGIRVVRQSSKKRTHEGCIETAWKKG